MSIAAEIAVLGLDNRAEPLRSGECDDLFQHAPRQDPFSVVRKNDEAVLADLRLECGDDLIFDRAVDRANLFAIYTHHLLATGKIADLRRRRSARHAHECTVDAALASKQLLDLITDDVVADDAYTRGVRVEGRYV